MGGDAGDGEDGFFGGGDALAAAEVESIDGCRFDFGILNRGSGCACAEVATFEEGVHGFFGGRLVASLYGDCLTVDLCGGSGDLCDGAVDSFFAAFAAVVNSLEFDGGLGLDGGKCCEQPDGEEECETHRVGSVP